jgi:hypothetical protein
MMTSGTQRRRINDQEGGSHGEEDENGAEEA